MIFYTHIRTERVRTFVIISFILNEFSYGKAQIPHCLFVAIRYLIDVSMHAVFFHTISSKDRMSLLDWLVGCFGFNDPLRQYFSLYRAVSQREGERAEKDRGE